MPAANQLPDTMADAAAMLQQQINATREKQAMAMPDIRGYLDAAKQQLSGAWDKAKAGAGDLYGKATAEGGPLAGGAMESVRNALSNIPTSMLVGGGLGLGAGVLGTAASSDRRKRWLRNALLGAGLGAGAGGALTAAQSLYDTAGGQTDLEKGELARRAAEEAAAAKNKPRDALWSMVTNLADHGSVYDPTPPTPGKAAPTGGGATGPATPAPDKPSFLMQNYGGTLSTAAGSTAGGFLGGLGYDKWKQHHVKAEDLMREVSGLPEKPMADMKAFQNNVYAAQKNGGGVSLSPLTGRPVIDHGPSQPAPAAKPAAVQPQPATAETSSPTPSPTLLSPLGQPAPDGAQPPTRPRRTPVVAPAGATKATTPPAAPAAAPKAGPAATKSRYEQPFNKQQWEQTFKPALRQNRPLGRTGRVIGTAAGFAVTPAVNATLNWLFGPGKVVQE